MWPSEIFAELRSAGEAIAPRVLRVAGCCSKRETLSVAFSGEPEPIVPWRSERTGEQQPHGVTQGSIPSTDMAAVHRRSSRSVPDVLSEPGPSVDIGGFTRSFAGKTEDSFLLPTDGNGLVNFGKKKVTFENFFIKAVSEGVIKDDNAEVLHIFSNFFDKDKDKKLEIVSSIARFLKRPIKAYEFGDVPREKIIRVWTGEDDELMEPTIYVDHQGTKL